MAVFDWEDGGTYSDMASALAGGASFGLVMSENYSFPGGLNAGASNIYNEAATIIIPAFNTSAGLYTVDIYGTVGNIADDNQIELVFASGVGIGIDCVGGMANLGLKIRNLKLSGGTAVITMLRTWTAQVPLFQNIYMPSVGVGISTRFSGVIDGCIIYVPSGNCIAASSGNGVFVYDSILICIVGIAVSSTRFRNDYVRSTIYSGNSNAISGTSGGDIIECVIYGATYAIGSTVLNDAYSQTLNSIFYSASDPSFVASGLTLDDAFPNKNDSILSDPLLAATGDAYAFVIPGGASLCDPANRSDEANQIYTGKLRARCWIGAYSNYIAVSADDIIDEAGGNFKMGDLSDEVILKDIEWGLTGTGNRTDAPAAKVEDGISYGPGGTGIEGELVIDYASGDDLRDGVTQNSGAIVGNLVVPTAAQVKGGVFFDSNGSVEGTYVFDYPSVDDVRLDTIFDSGNLTGNLRVPAIIDVRLGTVFDTLDSLEGNVVIPNPYDVRRGVTYDSDNSVVGTYDVLAQDNDPSGTPIRTSNPIIGVMPSGMAYATGTPITAASIVNPTLEVSPLEIYVSQGQSANIVYSTENAERVIIDGVDSLVTGMISRIYDTLGTTVINITAYGVSGSTPVTASAKVICLSASATPPVIDQSKNLSINCGPNKECAEGVVKVPYWTRYASSVIAEIYLDGELVSNESVNTANYGTRFFNFDVSLGVYTVVFTATAGDETKTATCTMTCGIAPMEEYALDIITPWNLQQLPADKQFELVAFLSCDLDITTLDSIEFLQTSGDGNLFFEQGAYAEVDENYVATLRGVSYELPGGEVTGSVDITAKITIAGVEYTSLITLGMVSDYIDVTITPSVYQAGFFAGDLVWTLDAVIKAYNYTGQITDFAEVVSLLGQISPRSNWLGRTDIEGLITSYVPGDTWDAEAVVIDPGLTELPAEAFLDGACTVRVLVEAPEAPLDLYAPYDSNYGFGVFYLEANVNTGTPMALGLGGADLAGVDGLLIGLPDVLEDDTAMALTMSVEDAFGNTVPASKYASTTATIEAIDDNGDEVQVSIDGITYVSSMEVPYGDLDVYYDLSSAVSPIKTSVILSGLDYKPYGVATREATAYYTLDGTVYGSQNLDTLFVNERAGTYRISVGDGFAIRYNPLGDWNEYTDEEYQGGGIFINIDGIDTGPGIPTKLGARLSGFKPVGEGKLVTSGEAETYSENTYTEMYLPAGQLWWYLNDNPVNDNIGSATYGFVRIGD